MSDSPDNFTQQDQHSPLDCPEDRLWVRHADRSLTIIAPERLYDLVHGAAPRMPVEALIAASPDWVLVYLTSFRGTYPVELPAAGPLPDLGDLEGAR